MGGARYLGQREANRAINRSIGETINAAKVQQRQQAVAAALERSKNINQARKVVGALRVAGGESGGVEGSYAALIREADFDANLNQEIIELNLATNQQRVASGANARSRELTSQKGSSLLAGVQGAIQGAMIGKQASGLFDTTGGGSFQPTYDPVNGGTYMANPLETPDGGIL